MNILTFPNRHDMNEAGAGIIAGLVQTNPRAVLGFATGSSPVGIYEELAKIHHKGMVSFRHTTAFNLDEYVGLPKEHPQSYYNFMQRHLYRYLDLLEERRYVPDGNAEDLGRECARYDSLIDRVGQIDLQLLGLGHNGHVGFNEPNHTLVSGTHLVRLHEETRAANARFFHTMEEVPSHALTMGIGSIMRAKMILLVVSGADKAEIVCRALTGPITTQCPASLLQLHSRVVVLLSEGAGSAIRMETVENVDQR
jgi:glucosamine-6-phosphate deaminase